MRFPWMIVRARAWQDAQDARAGLQSHVQFLKQALAEEKTKIKNQTQIIADLKNALLRKEGPNAANRDSPNQESH